MRTELFSNGDLDALEGDALTTIYALDTDRKDGWETGFVTEFVSRIPFKDFGEDYSSRGGRTAAYDEVYRPGSA